MAGTLAFNYSILSDPKKFVDSYGSWQTKLALIFFSMSFFYGIKVIIGSTAQTAIANSETFKKTVELNQALEKNLNEESKEADQKRPLEKIVGEGLANSLIFHLKGAKSFWFQLGSFTFGAGILFITFLVKDF